MGWINDGETPMTSWGNLCPKCTDLSLRFPAEFDPIKGCRCRQRAARQAEGKGEGNERHLVGTDAGSSVYVPN